jgi:hypothetical protein
MKCFSVAVLLFLLPLFSPLCTAADIGWDVSLELGSVQFTGLLDSDGPFSNPSHGTTVGDRGVSQRIGAGYRFNSYFGLETDYIHFGSATETLDACTPGGGSRVCSPYEVDLDTNGIEFAAIGYWPLTEYLSLSGRVGLAQSRTTESYTPHADSTSLTYGLAVCWALVPRLGLRLGVDAYPRLGGDMTQSRAAYHYGVRTISLGLVYSFR